MSSITELKDEINTKTINLFLLTLATAGIYLLIWLNDNHKIIDRITKTKTADNVYIIWIAVVLGLTGIFECVGEESFILINNVLLVAYGVLYVVWAFRAKKALENYVLNEYKVILRMNVLYTFLFNIYYINYCINDLPELERKQKTLNNSKEENSNE